MHPGAWCSTRKEYHTETTMTCPKAKLLLVKLSCFDHLPACRTSGTGTSQLMLHIASKLTYAHNARSIALHYCLCCCLRSLVGPTDSSTGTKLVVYTSRKRGCTCQLQCRNMLEQKHARCTDLATSHGCQHITPATTQEGQHGSDAAQLRSGCQEHNLHAQQSSPQTGAPCNRAHRSTNHSYIAGHASRDAPLSLPLYIQQAGQADAAGI